MPRDETLRGWNIAVAKAELPVGPADNGSPRTETRWIFQFVDRQTTDTIRFAFDDAVRDHIVRELTGGIVLAGGDLPKL